MARELGVARPTVNRWVQRDHALGEPALAALKQGRPPHPNWKRSLRSSGSSVGSSVPTGGGQLLAPLGALCATQNLFHRGPSFGASSPPGAAVGGPARRPNRVVLPAALQSRTQPGRVLEPGHMIVIYLG